MSNQALQSSSEITSALKCVSAEKGQWLPPRKHDSRGPCPLLNTLANHHFLPHSGKDINVPVLVDALHDALNLNDSGRAFFQVQGEKALTISTNTDSTTFNLLDLKAHNVIEHDGSLSRADGAVNDGDSWTFNQSIFDETKRYWPNGTISVRDGANALFQRQRSAAKINPNFELPYEQLINAVGQTAMYLGVFGTYAAGNATREWVEYFFENERFPYELGWQRKPDNESISKEGIEALGNKVAASWSQINATTIF
ncbi:hypothetical protein N0V90_007009 [Kalmusia sp. IMI 367209]|nr:hypothetical protein N0V90_007009 [Kalmusia sp. IMI 367209]